MKNKEKRLAITHLQPHLNGELYIQLRKYSSWIINSNEYTIYKSKERKFYEHVKFDITNRRGELKYSVSGIIIKQTKAGIILKNWRIYNYEEKDYDMSMSEFKERK